jgi:ribosomal-protein-alanine N-acetyltransferase
MPNFTPHPNPNPVSLRRATSVDIPRMRELEQQAETAAHWSTAQYDALFADEEQARIAIIAVEEPDNVATQGFLVARCVPDEWEIENVIVEERHRRRGVGSSLVRELLAEARNAGALSVILEVRESNRPARRLYESIGFRLEGRRKNYYQDPAEDALLYRTTITDL